MTSATVASEMTAATKVHPFERAGLGVAPFRLVGCEYVVYQAVPGDPNCPIQPGGSCDYCSTGISNFYWIESADGKRFKVGSNCVAKTGDRRLVDAVETEERKRDRVKREAKATAVRTYVTAMLADETTRAKLAALPHPRLLIPVPGRAVQSLLTWAEWMLNHAGATGRAQVAKAIKRAVEA